MLHFEPVFFKEYITESQHICWATKRYFKKCNFKCQIVYGLNNVLNEGAMLSRNRWAACDAHKDLK